MYVVNEARTKVIIRNNRYEFYILPIDRTHQFNNDNLMFTHIHLFFAYFHFKKSFVKST